MFLNMLLKTKMQYGTYSGRDPYTGIMAKCIGGMGGGGGAHAYMA